jgi:hypothetical protein
VLATVLGSVAPLLSLGVTRWTTGSSHDRAPGQTRKVGLVSSLGLPLSYRVRCSPSGPRLHARPRSIAKPLAPPVRSLPLQRLPVLGSGTKVTELPELDRPTPSGFLNLVASSSAHGPAGLVSCQIRSWGSPFKALLLPCSRTPSPAPLPSCRWNAPSSCPNSCWSSRVPKHRARPPAPHKWAGRRIIPRLQGFAPHESPPPRPGCLHRSKARSSPGIRPLQGFHPRRNGTAFTVPPLMRFPVGRKRPFGLSSGVSYPARLAGLSRDCRPSWGFASS